MREQVDVLHMSIADTTSPPRIPERCRSGPLPAPKARPSLVVAPVP